MPLTTTLTAEIIAIIAASLVGASTFILKLLKVSVTDWAKKKYHALFAKDVISKDDTIRERRINELLVELRVETDADRSYIFKFHNGEYFSPRDPVWKLTCTNETVRSGISYQIHNLRGILVSSVIDVVAPLFIPPVGIRGFTEVDHTKTGCDPVCAVTKNTVICDVDYMAESAGKAMLVEQGIHKMLLTPLKHHEQTLGFIGVDYCYEIDVDIKTVVPPLCKLSGQIAFLLYG